jgi:membrane-bound lytic murein transglycosylase D
MRFLTTFALPLLILLVACQTTPPPPMEVPPPEAASIAVADLEPIAEPAEPEEIEIEIPEAVALDDWEEDSPLISPEEDTLPPHPAVEAAIAYYAERVHDKFQAALDRFGQHRPMFQSAFEEAGTPADLIYLTLTESMCRPRARSRVGAYGMWQFMRGTARIYGLTINSVVDERAHIEKSTRAAARYLRNSLDELDNDRLLAIASYNCGLGNVNKAMKRCKSDDFWTLRPCLPKETRNFVPSVLAAIEIGSNPAKYGFSYSEEPWFHTEDLYLPTSVDLQKLSWKAGLTLETLLDLNPELRGKYTPQNGYSIRVPEGTRDLLMQGIPVHVVQPGDCLSSLAARFKVKQSLLARVNNLDIGQDLMPGQPLFIPEAIYEGYHTVKKGESPYSIARKYGVPLQRLLEANGFTQRTIIRPGQQIKVPGMAGEATVMTTKTYKIRRGDTLAKIARQFSTSVDRLKAANNLTSDLLHPGQTLVIQ